MSKMTAAVISELKADATVAGIVGTKIYDTVARPQTATPYITVQTVAGGEPSHSQDGTSGLQLRRLQLNAYPKTLAQGRSILDAILAALDGKHNVTIGTTPNDLAIRSLLVIDDWDDFYAPPAGTGKPGFIVRMELEGWHA